MSSWTSGERGPRQDQNGSQGVGVTAYGGQYRWLTDSSGLGLAEQAQMLMLSSPPKKEEDLAERVETWQDNMRRLEAHGEEFKLAPLF
jgi:hypothetical protein